MEDRQTGLFVKKAFLQLGGDMETLDANTEPERLREAVASMRPDLMFCSRTPELLDGAKAVKQDFPDVTRMCWNVDKRYRLDLFPEEMIELFGQMDILYTTAKGNIPQYKAILPDVTVRHLQQGCDPEVHRTEELTPEEVEKYKCDIMFAGTYPSKLHHGRDRLFKILIKYYDLRIYGDVQGNRIEDSEQNKANRGAKIVLGHNGWAMLELSMSVRDYKVMGSGGFLLTEHCPGIKDWFSVGSDCETYFSLDECRKKLDYYLEHPEERARIAATGQRTVHEHHTYVHRMRQVLADYEGRK